MTAMLQRTLLFVFNKNKMQTKISLCIEKVEYVSLN